MNIKTIEDITQPGVLVFHLSEFFRDFGMPDIRFSQTVYDSPFYIYDTSLKDAGPEFEDETEISDEDCNTGFSIVETIWSQYVGRAKTPAFKYIFNLIKDFDDDGSFVGSIYGFAPGYDMNSAIEAVAAQKFTVFTWDEFWDNNLVLMTDSNGGISRTSNENSEYVQLLLKIDTESYMSRTSFGGFPVKDRDTIFEWPRCYCGKEFQYQCKIRTDLGLEMIFMPNCGHDSNNKVIIIDSWNLEFVYPQGNHTDKVQFGTEMVRSGWDSYESSAACEPVHYQNVFGRINRYSLFIQQDNNPKCDCCEKEMQLVARFKGDSGVETPMTSGGKYSYLYHCTTGKTAKFITDEK